MTSPGNVPATSPTGGSPTTTTLPRPPRSNPLPMAGIIALIVAIVLVFMFYPRQTKEEKLAARVTQAVVNNDMRPVENDFDEKARARVQNRVRVARLSDTLAPLGKFKGVKDDTPSGSIAGFHHFQAQFEKGTWVEDMSLDSDGKIAAWHIHAPADTGK